MKVARQGTQQKRTAAQRAADLVIVERETLRGTTQSQLVELLAKQRPYKLSRQMIGYDQKDLERRWVTSATNNIVAARSKSIAALEEQRRELWAAWEKSKADATSRTTERPALAPAEKPAKGKKKGEQSDVERDGKERVTVEQQCGDPAYMRLILDIEKRIADLRGLDAPVRQDFTSAGQPLPSGSPTQIVIYLPQKVVPDENGGNGSHALIVERTPELVAG